MSRESADEDLRLVLLDADPSIGNEGELLPKFQIQRRYLQERVVELIH